MVLGATGKAAATSTRKKKKTKKKGGGAQECCWITRRQQQQKPGCYTVLANAVEIEAAMSTVQCRTDFVNVHCYRYQQERRGVTRRRTHSKYRRLGENSKRRREHIMVTTRNSSTLPFSKMPSLTRSSSLARKASND
jgi:hypothetical protein